MTETENAAPLTNDAAAAAPLAGLTLTERLLAGLQFVLKFHNKLVSINDMHGLAPIPAPRAELPDLLPLLKRLNYAGRIIKLDQNNIVRMPCPFLLTSDDEETIVVVKKIDRHTVEIFDPADDRRADIGLAALLRLKPYGLVVKRAAAADLNWLDQMRVRIKAVMGQIILSSVMINIFALALPLASMIIFNKVMGHQAYSTLHVIVIATVVTYIFDTLLKGARSYLSTHTGARLDALLGSEMIGHLLRLPLTYFERNASGVIAERIRQMDVIRNFMTGQMPLLLVDLFFSIILFIAIFCIDYRLGFVALAVVPLFVGISFYFDGTQRRYSNQNFEAMTSKASSLNELMSNALTIKSTGLESEMERKHGELLARTAWTSFQAQNINQHIYNITNLIMAFASLLVLYLGTMMIMEQTLTIGGLIAVNMLVGRTLAPIRQVTTAWHSLREAQHAFHRIQDIMAETTERSIADTATYPRLSGKITLDKIYYHYDKNLPPVLREVSLQLPPGTITGLVGASGSGKSTLGKVMIGVYPPHEGRVLMGDLDISHVAPSSLRRDIGYVPQDNQLFAGTVRDNILLGANNPSPAKAMMAAQFAGAHDFIQKLPHGYDTQLGERGLNISSGQRQLICISRALAREPRILIMDEATSALDLLAEERLLLNLKAATQKHGLTVVFITHRLGTLRLCDQVVLLKDGMVEQQGPPEQIFNLLLPPQARPQTAPPEAKPADDNGAA